MEANDNKNTTVQNLWDAAKAILRGKDMAIQAFFKKQEKLWGFFVVFFLKILFDRERHSKRGNTSRGISKGRGRSRLPAKQGAQRGAQSQDPRITTQAECRCLTSEPPRHPRRKVSNTQPNLTPKGAG